MHRRKKISIIFEKKVNGKQENEMFQENIYTEIIFTKKKVKEKKMATHKKNKLLSQSIMKK